MYKKLTALAVAALLGTTLTAQETQCPKGEQKGQCAMKGKPQGGKCGMRGGKGPMGGHHGGQGMMIGHMFKDLDLSEEQKAQIQELVTTMKESSEAKKDDFKSHMETQKEFIEADTFDEQAFRAQFKEAAQLKEDMAVEQMLIKREIKAVLTEEQREQMKEMIAQKKEQWEKMKGQRGQGCPKKKSAE